MPVSKLIVNTANSAEPITLPRIREGFTFKLQQIHLFQEEMGMHAVEVKTTASSLITLHPS